jgi:hypothetical protein
VLDSYGESPFLGGAGGSSDFQNTMLGSAVLVGAIGGIIAQREKAAMEGSDTLPEDWG